MKGLQILASGPSSLPTECILGNERESWPVLALLTAVGIPAFAALVLKGPWRAWLGPWLGVLADGPRELVAHLLYGLPAALLSGLAIYYWRLGPLHFRPALGRGLVLTALSVLVCAPFAGTPGPGLTCWGVAGNLVSNFYEELSFLALVALAALRWPRRPALAVLLCGVVCALPRWDGVWLNLFLLGCLYAAWFVRDRNLFVPWMAHTMVDLIFGY